MIRLDMEIRDLGVQSDYVERAFKKDDRRLQDARTGRAKVRLEFGARDTQKADIEALAAVQATRPLKPPGKR